MSRLGDVLGAIAGVISAAINTAGITTPNQVGVGWPNVTDLSAIIKAGEFQVSLYTANAGTRNTSRFFPRLGYFAAPVVNLTAAVVGNVITFAGSVPTSGYQYNVHTLFGTPLQDAYYQTKPGDTPTSVASSVAAAVVAQGGSATSSGPVLTTQTNTLICNIGTSIAVVQEALRVMRDVQVTVWAPTPTLRESVEDAILSQVGTALAPRVTLPDGTTAWVRYSSNGWIDETPIDASIYESHLLFAVEYGVLATSTATQIGAFNGTIEGPGPTTTFLEG